MKSNRSIGIWITAGIAFLFGFITIKAGGSVLFVGGRFQEEAGNYVPFVLWFNFFAGFVYIIAEALQKRFQHDENVQLVEKKADIIVEGQIIEYKINSASFQSPNAIQTNSVSIKIKLKSNF